MEGAVYLFGKELKGNCPTGCIAKEEVQSLQKRLNESQTERVFFQESYLQATEASKHFKSQLSPLRCRLTKVEQENLKLRECIARLQLNQMRSQSQTASPLDIENATSQWIVDTPEMHNRSPQMSHTNLPEGKVSCGGQSGSSAKSSETKEILTASSKSVTPLMQMPISPSLHDLLTSETDKDFAQTFDPYSQIPSCISEKGRQLTIDPRELSNSIMEANVSSLSREQLPHSGPASAYVADTSECEQSNQSGESSFAATAAYSPSIPPWRLPGKTDTPIEGSTLAEERRRKKRIANLTYRMNLSKRRMLHSMHGANSDAYRDGLARMKTSTGRLSKAGNRTRI